MYLLINYGAVMLHTYVHELLLPTYNLGNRLAIFLQQNQSATQGDNGRYTFPWPTLTSSGSAQPQCRRK